MTTCSYLYISPSRSNAGHHKNHHANISTSVIAFLLPRHPWPSVQGFWDHFWRHKKPQRREVLGPMWIGRRQHLVQARNQAALLQGRLCFQIKGNGHPEVGIEGKVWKKRKTSTKIIQQRRANSGISTKKCNSVSCTLSQKNKEGFEQNSIECWLPSIFHRTQMPYHWEQNHGKSKAGMLKGSPFQPQLSSGWTRAKSGPKCLRKVFQEFLHKVQGLWTAGF